MNKIFAGGLFAIAALLSSMGSAQAQVQQAALPSVHRPAAIVGEARPVAAWVRFCQNHPQECLVRPSEATSIALTTQTWRTITTINRYVNETIKPMTDQEQWGLIDSWDFPTTGAGDCEDYQLLKRKLLADAGVPRRAMRMTVVIDEKGEGHAVLTIMTDRGDFVLDNKIDAVLPWHRTGYIYVKREGSNGLDWVSLGGATSPTVTANR
jgi:predicted transglutaminase-like cysteine proteinase